MNWLMGISSIILIYLFLLVITPKGYYSYMPSWLAVYPKNKNEIPIVIQARESITPELIQFHKRTDPSVIFAFYDFLKQRGIQYPLKQLQDHVISWNVVLPVYLLKWLHNRRRVYQYVPGINLPTKTAFTPAYPAGHAYQAYTLAKILSKEYPQYRSEFIKLAEKCDYVRIAAGLHYPSDGEYSRWLVGDI
jgi:hypothetical protein